MLRILAFLLFPLCLYALDMPEYLAGPIETYEYESDELIHHSEGHLSTAQGVGLKFEYENETYYLYQEKIYRHQKRLNQVIVYEQVPDVIKSISWLIDPKKLIGSYQMTQSDRVITWQSYSGNETIVIQYDKNHIPKSASWKKGVRKFLVIFNQVSTQPFSHEQLKPVFSHHTDIINFGEQYE